MSVARPIPRSRYRVSPHLRLADDCRRRHAKALSTFMGHANISTTLDRYGHLMPGTEAEAATLLDSYLTAQREQAEDAAREAVAA